MISALIFDVDGTLAETEEAHRLAFNQIFADFGLDWTWSVSDYTDLLRITGGKERMKAYRNQCGLTAPADEEIARLHAAKTARFVSVLASGVLMPRPGITDLVRHANSAGLKLAVATTTSRPNVDAVCQSIWKKDAEEVFSVIAAGDDVTNKKPAPDVYHLALQRLHMPPEQAIALEDSSNGLGAARRAGLRVIASPSAYTAGNDLTGADWCVASFERSSLSPQPWNTIFPTGQDT